MSVPSLHFCSFAGLLNGQMPLAVKFSSHKSQSSLQDPYRTANAKK
jgi:hypothetical protein